MAAPAMNTLEVKLVLDDQLTGALKKVQADLDRLHRRANIWGSGWVSMWKTSAGAMAGVVRSLVSVRNAFLAVGAAWTGIKMANHAVTVENLESGYKSLAKRIGEDYMTVLARLRGATKGTVSDMGLMQSANRAILLGAAKSSEDLEILAITARRLGRVMGQDVAKSYDDLVLAIGRMSPRVLDNIGIVVKQRDAQEEYAKMVGKTVDKLTAEERMMAFRNMAMKKAIDYTKSLGEDVDTVADKWGRFKATVENYYNFILKALLPVLGSLSETLTKIFVDNKEQIFSFFADMVEAAASALPTIIGFFNELGTAISLAFGSMQPLISGMAQFFEWREAAKLDKNREAFLESFRDKVPIAGENIYYGPRQWKEVVGNPFYPEGGYWYRNRRDPVQAAEMAKEYMKSSPDSSGIPMEVWREMDAYNYATDQYSKANQMSLLAQGKISWNNVQTSDFQKSALEAANQLRNMGKIPVDSIYREPTYKPGIVDQADAAAKKATELQLALLGVSDALQEIYFQGTDTFTQLKTLVSGVSNSLVDGLAEGFTKALFSAKNFGEAMKEMAKSMAEDITKLIIKLLLMRTLGLALGGLFGDTIKSPVGIAGQDTPAATGPFSNQPISQGGVDGIQWRMQARDMYSTGSFDERAYGGTFGVFDRPTLLAEGSGQVEAAVPLPDGRRIPVEFLDEARSNVTNVYNINTIDAKTFDEYFNQAAGRQRKTIGKIASQQFQNDRGVRRGFQA